MTRAVRVGLLFHLPRHRRDEWSPNPAVPTHAPATAVDDSTKRSAYFSPTLSPTPSSSGSPAPENAAGSVQRDGGTTVAPKPRAQPEPWVLDAATLGVRPASPPLASPPRESPRSAQDARSWGDEADRRHAAKTRASTRGGSPPPAAGRCSLQERLLAEQCLRAQAERRALQQARQTKPRVLHTESPTESGSGVAVALMASLARHC